MSTAGTDDAVWTMPPVFRWWGGFEAVGEGVGETDRVGAPGPDCDEGTDEAGHAVSTATAARHGMRRETPLRIGRGWARSGSTTPQILPLRVARSTNGRPQTLRT